MNTPRPDPDQPTWMASDASQVERRPDPHDLTPLISQLTKEEYVRVIAAAQRDAHRTERLGFWACVAFWILAGGFAVVAIWWGVRQLL